MTVCILLCLPAMFLQAQNQALPTIFTINKMELELADYPWWQELSLNLSGYAHPVCENASLLVSIFYEKRKVQGFEFTIPPQTNDNLPWLVFEKQWEPINRAVQAVPAGTYQIKVELILVQQTQAFQARWKKIFKDLLPPSYDKDVRLGSEELKRQEAASEVQFYVTRMQKLNFLFNDLEAKKLEAFSIRQGTKNMFAENGQFSPKKWAHWLENEFTPKIDAEREILKKHREGQFFCRYLVSQSGMETYTNLLPQLAQVATQAITKAYQQGRTTAHLRKMAIRARENIAVTVEFIQQIHSSCACELNISLREKIGYLPPFKN